MSNNEDKKMVFLDKPTKCPRCDGKLILKGRGAYVCEDCGKVVFDDFGKVRNFIEDYGPSSAVVIAAGTGVNIDKIQRFLREGRLEVPEGSDQYISCEKCGAAIKYGRFCPECAATLTKSIAALIKPEDIGEKPKNRAGKMYTRNNK